MNCSSISSSGVCATSRRTADGAPVEEPDGPSRAEIDAIRTLVELEQVEPGTPPRLGERDPLAERSVEIELRRLGLHLRQLVHELDPLAADPEEAEKARARIRDGECRQERSEREGGKRKHEAPPRTPVGGGCVERSEHARREIRRGRHVELAAEGQECPLELAHGLHLRREGARAPARFVTSRFRRLTPSTSAVSCSLSSRK